MSLLARIQAAEAAGVETHRSRRFGMEAAREHCKARLLAAEMKLVRLSRDDELVTTFAEVLDRIARNEHLERMGGFA